MGRFSSSEYQLTVLYTGRVSSGLLCILKNFLFVLAPSPVMKTTFRLIASICRIASHTMGKSRSAVTPLEAKWAYGHSSLKKMPLTITTRSCLATEACRQHTVSLAVMLEMQKLIINAAKTCKPYHPPPVNLSYTRFSFTFISSNTRPQYFNHCIHYCTSHTIYIYTIRETYSLKVRA